MFPITQLASWSKSRPPYKDSNGTSSTWFSSRCCSHEVQVPSCELSHFAMENGQSTISMAIFHGKMWQFTRGYVDLPSQSSIRGAWSSRFNEELASAGSHLLLAPDSSRPQQKWCPSLGLQLGLRIHKFINNHKHIYGFVWNWSVAHKSQSEHSSDWDFWFGKWCDRPTSMYMYIYIYYRDIVHGNTCMYIYIYT